MGAHPYWYFVKYDSDIEAALQELREREFSAGRYNPVTPFPDFPIGPDSPAPGAEHASIDEAMMDAEEDGTRSILDIQGIAYERDLLVAAPLSAEELQAFFGTTRPTRQIIEQSHGQFEDLERGHCIYVVVFKDGKPDELYFAGYSVD